MGVQSVAQGVSPGNIDYFAAATPPNGWIKANGAAVSRATYAALFLVIGVTYGVGDGSTTFNVPDLRGEFPRGWDDGRGIDSGRAIATAQAANLSAHTHFTFGSGGAANNNAIGTGDPSVSPSMPTSSTGTGTDNRPRNVALLACIKY